jgi:nucleoid-associated protein YgaU
MVRAVGTRNKKLAAAGTVLAVGFVLAWPLRKTGPSGAAPAAAPGPSPVLAPTMPLGLGPQFSPQAAAPASMASLRTGGPGDLSASIPALPALPTVDVPQADDAEPAPRIHVVHNGDTLERLAKSYLGNEGRALEIFDRNRDVLTNPHLLPIGAELRIPGAAEQHD